jgi:MerR family transcriptional regulator, repressor of the yfmOP operon
VSEEPRGLRIGEVAERTGTTPRTIRYYEEIGLLPAAHERAPGSHRLYDEADVRRLEEVLRLKQLLGVSLDELSELVAAETARAELRSEWHSHEASPTRQRAILEEALGLVDRQLELVAGRRREIARLEEELSAKRERLRARLAELEREPAAKG